MKNVKVRDLIEILKKLDQEAVVCIIEIENDKPIFNSIDMIKQADNVTYINDVGDEEIGNVVAIC